MTTTTEATTEPATYEEEMAAAQAAYPGLSAAEAYSQWQLDRYNERQS